MLLRKDSGPGQVSEAASSSPVGPRVQHLLPVEDARPPTVAAEAAAATMAMGSALEEADWRITAAEVAEEASKSSSAAGC